MGMWDFQCTVKTEVRSTSNTAYVIRVSAYWKNVQWNYDINYVYAWVTCNGQEVCVKNNGPVNTTGVSQNGGETLLGYYDFTVSRGTSNVNIACSARLQSNSSYVSGSRSSGTAYVTVNAKPSYTVSYNANGGSGAPGNQTKWYDTNLTLSSTKPTRTGYTFKGWATSSGGGVAYNSGGTYSGNAALTLYAVWQINTWTVSYNANGGSGAPGNQTKTYGQNLTLSSTKPTRTGYIFNNWKGSDNNTYNPGGTYAGNLALTLTAQWSLITYTVSYNANGGSGAPGNQTKNYGQNLTLSSTKPTRTNYNFKGWATSSGGGVAYNPGGTYTGNANLTLHAVWELAYIAPRLTGFKAIRTDSDGNASETGKNIKVTFSWATDKVVSKIEILHRAQSTSTWTHTSVTASGTSDNVSKIIGRRCIKC